MILVNLYSELMILVYIITTAMSEINQLAQERQRLMQDFLSVKTQLDESERRK